MTILKPLFLSPVDAIYIHKSQELWKIKYKNKNDLWHHKHDYMFMLSRVFWNQCGESVGQKKLEVSDLGENYGNISKR